MAQIIFIPPDFDREKDIIRKLLEEAIPLYQKAWEYVQTRYTWEFDRECPELMQEHESIQQYLALDLKIVLEGLLFLEEALPWLDEEHNNLFNPWIPLVNQDPFWQENGMKAIRKRVAEKLENEIDPYREEKNYPDQDMKRSHVRLDLPLREWKSLEQKVSHGLGELIDAETDGHRREPGYHFSEEQHPGVRGISRLIFGSSAVARDLGRMRSL